jgi:hypothetical protein
VRDAVREIRQIVGNHYVKRLEIKMYACEPMITYSNEI